MLISVMSGHTNSPEAERRKRGPEFSRLISLPEFNGSSEPTAAMLYQSLPDSSSGLAIEYTESLASDNSAPSDETYTVK